jgi:transcriptional regulator with XRE-family HTH domain
VKGCVSTKKRKTPASPRAPFAHESTRERVRQAERDPGSIVVMATGPHIDRDTDEQDVSSIHDFGHDFADVPRDEDELLDLGALGEISRVNNRTPALGSGAYGSQLATQPTAVRDVATAPADERRLTPTLLKILSRRRQQIRLSLDQLARLSGISIHHLEQFEQPKVGQTITYDQVVVLARVLGIQVDQLPGLRPRENRPHLGVLLAELERTMLGAPMLRFEGKHGERFGGDVERAAGSKACTVRVEDDSLEPVLPRGSLLGFMSGTTQRPGHILLLRHRRSALLALRRNEPPNFAGLLAWQPSYVAGGEWHVIGSMEVLLPPR